MDRRLSMILCIWLTTCGQTSQLQSSQTDAATLSISPGPVFSFQDQLNGQAISQIFTVTNTGSRTASQFSSSFYLSSTFSYVGGYPGADGTCGTQLGSGESCQVRVTFSPLYTGTFQQVFPFSFYDGYAAQLVQFPVLRGNGI